MPWTKINYPDSMKKLPVAVRNKAIEIANAILKENKKMKEGILIATAIKHAKAMAVKSEKKTKGVAKKKTKSADEKKKISTANKNTKIVVKKKIKSIAKIKAKVVVEKKVKSPAKIEAKVVISKETKKTSKEKAPNPILESSLPSTITHGEDLHFIPEKGELHQVTKFEAHQIENIFHHREEVALHQENQKVKAAMPSRKNSKKSNHTSGRR